MKNFINLISDKKGASAAEYALILAIIGVAIAVAAITLGGEIGDSMNETASCVESSTDCT